MGYLVVSVVAALAMSISIYDVSGSFLLAFLGYSLTGTIVLLTVLFAECLGERDADQFNTTE